MCTFTLKIYQVSNQGLQYLLNSLSEFQISTLQMTQQKKQTTDLISLSFDNPTDKQFKLNLIKKMDELYLNSLNIKLFSKYQLIDHRHQKQNSDEFQILEEQEQLAQQLQDQQTVTELIQQKRQNSLKDKNQDENDQRTQTAIIVTQPQLQFQLQSSSCDDPDSDDTFQNCQVSSQSEGNNENVPNQELLQNQQSKEIRNQNILIGQVENKILKKNEAQMEKQLQLENKKIDIRNLENLNSDYQSQLSKEQFQIKNTSQNITIIDSRIDSIKQICKNMEKQSTCQQLSKQTSSEAQIINQEEESSYSTLLIEKQAQITSNQSISIQQNSKGQKGQMGQQITTKKYEKIFFKIVILFLAVWIIFGYFLDKMDLITFKNYIS